jgi:hypothetical protein
MDFFTNQLFRLLKLSSMGKWLSLLLFLHTQITVAQIQANIRSAEFRCDSIYPDQHYKLVQQTFVNGLDTMNDNNTVIVLFSAGKIILQDTVYSSNGNIEFRDFNNDGIRDLLIQNSSDARSNWMYYLYLVDTVHDKLTRIKGFEEIKNPKYLPKYDLIDNYVSSGTDWTSFYKIERDSITDFGIVIEDDHRENGNYERDYKKAIDKILGNEIK